MFRVNWLGRSLPARMALVCFVAAAVALASPGVVWAGSALVVPQGETVYLSGAYTFSSVDIYGSVLLEGDTVLNVTDDFTMWYPWASIFGQGVSGQNGAGGLPGYGSYYEDGQSAPMGEDGIDAGSGAEGSAGLDGGDGPSLLIDAYGDITIGARIQLRGGQGGRGGAGGGGGRAQHGGWGANGRDGYSTSPSGSTYATNGENGFDGGSGGDGGNGGRGGDGGTGGYGGSVTLISRNGDIDITGLVELTGGAAGDGGSGGSGGLGGEGRFGGMGGEGGSDRYFGGDAGNGGDGGNAGDGGRGGDGGDGGTGGSPGIGGVLQAAAWNGDIRITGTVDTRGGGRVSGGRGGNGGTGAKGASGWKAWGGLGTAGGDTRGGVNNYPGDPGNGGDAGAGGNGGNPGAGGNGGDSGPGGSGGSVFLRANGVELGGAVVNDGLAPRSAGNGGSGQASVAGGAGQAGGAGGTATYSDSSGSRIVGVGLAGLNGLDGSAGTASSAGLPGQLASPGEAGTVTVVEKGKAHVLCFGVGPAAEHKIVADAAKSFFSARSQRGGMGYEVYEPIDLPLGESGNLSAIENAIQAIRPEPEDVLIFFIGGHGGFEYGTDSEQDEAPKTMQTKVGPIASSGDEFVTISDDIEGTGVGKLRDDQLRGFFDTSSSGVDPNWDAVEKLFVIDSCYSGGFWGSTAYGDSGDLATLPKTALLASAMEEERSKLGKSDDGKEFGFLGLAFAAALVELKDEGGMITFADLSVQTDLEGQFFDGDMGAIRADWVDTSDELSVVDFEMVSGQTTDFQFRAGQVPEPATFLVLAVAGLPLLRRRKA